MSAHIELSTAATTSTAATYVYASNHGGAWTAIHDNASLTTVATEKITARRACKAVIAVGFRTNSTITDQRYVNAAAELNGTTNIITPFFVAANSVLNGQISGSFSYSFATDDYLRHKFRTEEANKGAALSFLNFLTFIEVK